MPIVTAAATIDPLAPLWPSLALALGAAVAVALGLWRRSAIIGPNRLDQDEPSEPLSIAAGCGLAVYFLCTLIAMRVVASAHPGPTTAGGDVKLTDAQSVVVDLAARFAAITAMLGVLGLLYHRVWRLGLSLRRILPGIAQALLAALVVLPLMWMTLAITEKLIHPEGELVHPYLKLIGESKDNLRLKAALLVSVIAAAPLSEEIFFRGCFQTILGTWLIRLSKGRRPAVARWLAVIIVSLLFAMVHESWSRPPIFVLALCLGYAYERTGNLWTPIFLHAMFNGVEVAMFLHSG